MDKILDERFGRVERALGNLVNSITKHKPTPAQVNDLLSSDFELQTGLLELQHHQTNYRRIEELKAASAVLDGQIRDTLVTLGNMRKELRALEPMLPTSDVQKYNVSYEELLNYARRISKTTMPPPGVTNGFGPAPAPAPPLEAQQQQPRQVDGAARGQQQPQSTTTTPRLAQTPLPSGAPPTPTVATPSQAQTPVQTTQNAAATPATPSNNNPTSNTRLPEHLTQQMNPYAGARFFPWPTEDKIRSGALAAIQSVAEQGIDPLGYDPAEEEARRRREEEEQLLKEERERNERQELERRAWEERERMRREREAKNAADGTQAGGATGAAADAGSAGGGGGAGSQAADRRQFQFASFDDEEDEDD